MTAWHILAGVGLDLVFGDPRWLPHPVRGFGYAAGRLEKLCRATRLPLRLSGALFTAVAVAGATTIVYVTLPWASVYWIWMLLALRDLDHEAALVLKALRVNDLSRARRLLSNIVGRDTAHLNESQILRAVIETVAENLSDAVIAPLFYLAIGGPAGMAAYKAVNTLDSMVGYRNSRYLEFGWASARLDDLLNWIPSRLSAALVWIAALLLGYDVGNSVRITFRDASNQPSPNSGYPEAAVAGALGVQLGGLNHYGGVPSRKEFLGDPLRPLSHESFSRTRRILYSASAVMVLAVIGIHL